ncbi:MAG: hypothetical protein H5T45_06730 [Thermoplasmatales archaeon]|nr:hypothetical protein [Thermoplasmatales archaeon]
MDKTTKALFVACFVLATALGFTTGPLLQEKPILPSKTTKNTTITTNKTTSNPGNTGTEPGNEWNVSFCPYCGAPLRCVDEVPYLIDANGIMHGHIYRVYECGHRVYMGEKTWRFYNMKPEYQEYYREYVKERGGEVYY